MNKQEKNSHFAFAYILALLLLNLFTIYFSSLDLAADEAHYWEWSRKLDWSYYSKGPIVAYLISISTAIFHNTTFAVRLPAALCHALTLCLFFLTAKSLTNTTSAFFWTVVLSSCLIFAQTGLAITTDPPMAFFWMCAIYYFNKVSEDLKLKFLLPFFSALALGTLAKLTCIILLPAALFTFILSPNRGKIFRSPFFYCGIFLMFTLLSPLVIWNMKYNWVNLLHNASHLEKSTGFSLSSRYLPELILGQIGLVGIIIFPFVVFAIYIRTKNLTLKCNPTIIFCLTTIFALTALCVLVSLGKRVYANWPLPIYLCAFIVVAETFSIQRLNLGKYSPLLKRGIQVNFLFLLIAYLLFWGYSFGLPGKILPTKKLFGWRVLAGEIEKVLSLNPKLNIITSNYGIASELAFYLKSQPQTFCAHVNGRRMNQYDIWGGLEKKIDEDFIIVDSSEESLEQIYKLFRSTSIANKLSINYGSSTIQEFQIAIGRGFKGNESSKIIRY